MHEEIEHSVRRYTRLAACGMLGLAGIFVGLFGVLWWHSANYGIDPDIFIGVAAIGFLLPAMTVAVVAFFVWRSFLAAAWLGLAGVGGIAVIAMLVLGFSVLWFFWMPRTEHVSSHQVWIGSIALVVLLVQWPVQRWLDRSITWICRMHLAGSRRGFQVQLTTPRPVLPIEQDT